MTNHHRDNLYTVLDADPQPRGPGWANRSVPLITNWLKAPGTITLDSTRVHVWKFPLDLQDRAVSRLEDVLSRDEQRRARRFRFARHRVRFTVARGRLRILLGRYLGRAPEQVAFGYGQRGKPDLAGVEDVRLAFNISHSRNIGIAAIALNRDVGIDVERIRSDTQFDKIAQRYFTRAEATSLQQFSETQQPAVFFRCWTLKEAYLKACGGGLTMGLDSLEVIISTNGKARVVGIRETAPQTRHWRFAELDPGEGYVASLAVTGGDANVYCLHWPKSESRGFPQLVTVTT